MASFCPIWVALNKQHRPLSRSSQQQHLNFFSFLSISSFLPFAGDGFYCSVHERMTDQEHSLMRFGINGIQEKVASFRENCRFNMRKAKEKKTKIRCEVANVRRTEEQRHRKYMCMWNCHTEKQKSAGDNIIVVVVFAFVVAAGDGIGRKSILPNNGIKSSVVAAALHPNHFSKCA